MSIKKINGYAVFLSEKLGTGSYGTVIDMKYCRYIRENKLSKKKLVLSK
jgi:hypothetical protein